MEKSISLIIPCYNEAENLSDKLAYLQETKSESLLEILVVDSPNSNDNSKEVCSEYPFVTYLRSGQAGRAYQMNLGAKNSFGDILLFVHADVKLPKNFAALILEKLIENELGFFNYEFDKPGFWLRFNASFVKEKGAFTGGGDQCHFFKKRTFEQLGGYNEEYSVMEDFELIDQVKKQNIPYSIIQTPVTVSARKYESNSWLKVNLINGYVFLLYKLGASPKRLQKGYQRLLRK